ncbi:PEP-CTERM system histidine kinase PrsK [Altererythrobacter salegens]|uniref:histidine kinase n=1 Tax=Croceibacterium salegens TaxID=1737568 RepID=A0A6I4SUF2_9SPHN|nr:XrtA/PEP-CTERM system histidine kinase PrsK [Croceibacterium salegens]MXO58727.1 PEP-CTERM system histidine kinase PrsK [Croceibacterium salegens]
MNGQVLGSLEFAAYLLSALVTLVMATWLFARRQHAAWSTGATAAALVVMAAWALARPVFGPDGLLGRLLLSMSYLVWLWVLYRMFARDGRHESLGPIRPVVLALGFVGLMQIALALAVVGEPTAFGVNELVRLGVAFRLLFCVGALVLVHNLYAGASLAARRELRWPAAAMALMWFYDLNFQTLSYLAEIVPATLAAVRSLVPGTMAILLAIGGMQRATEQTFRPSRAFAFQSISLLIIAAYFGLMVIAFRGIAMAGGDFAGLLQVAFLVAASAGALALLPSKRLRGWLHVTVAKNLFQHRYDYREEWLRFTRTMERAEALPLRERVVQAVADVTDSPAGLLLAPGDYGNLSLEARWQWPGSEIPAEAMGAAGMRFFADSQFILDLDHWRAGRHEGIPASAVPPWLADDARAWAVVPLLHYDRLLGVVVLARPAYARTLDWEDFDLLRVVGRQLANYLAEEASQDALGEAQRFDEFNRRIAFVMHDIKNLASQLSLLARNAEKHADKPEFRADMLVTLRKSSEKLAALLARLGRYGGQGDEPIAPVPVRSLLQSIAERYRAQHAVIALPGDEFTAEAQPEALDQALVHLVQNAVDASKDETAVVLDARAEGTEIVIEVSDSGCGMSPEFVRTRLFKPFHSSKPGGFGIGAHEARVTIRAMGGKLDVESREGLGTRFVIRLPRPIADSQFPSDNKIKTEVA